MSKIKLSPADKVILKRMREGGILYKSAGGLNYFVRKERMPDINMTDVNDMIKKGLIFNKGDEYPLTELGKTIEL
jgi:hypothetical protein